MGAPEDPCAGNDTMKWAPGGTWMELPAGLGRRDAQEGAVVGRVGIARE